MKANNQTEVKQQIGIAQGMSGLNELMLFDGEGNILKIDVVDSSSELYISVEKNGK